MQINFKKTVPCVGGWKCIYKNKKAPYLQWKQNAIFDLAWCIKKIKLLAKTTVPIMSDNKNHYPQEIHLRQQWQGKINTFSYHSPRSFQYLHIRTQAPAPCTNRVLIKFFRREFSTTKKFYSNFQNFHELAMTSQLDWSPGVKKSSAGGADRLKLLGTSDYTITWSISSWTLNNTNSYNIWPLYDRIDYL